LGTPDDDRCPTGIAVALGAAALIGTTVVAAAVVPAEGPRLSLIAVTVAVFAAVSGNGRAALAVAGLAWAIGNGFLINRQGELAWHPDRDPGFVLGLLIAVSVGMVLSQVGDEWRAHRRMRQFDDLLREAVMTPGAARPAPPDEPPAASERETTQQEAKER
jgi:hypothetical protein